MKSIVVFVPGGMMTPAGGERVIANLSNELTKKGYKIHIITFNGKNSYYKIDDDVYIKSLDINKSKNYLFRKIQPLFYLKKYRKIIKEIKPDIIIHSGVVAVIFSSLSLFGKKRNLTMMSWEHSSFFQPTYKILNILRNVFYPKLKTIVVLNKTDEIAYSNLFGSEKVKRISNPLPWKSKQNSNLDEKVLIAVGRYQEVKGFDILLKIFKEINLNHPDWKLKIFGKDEGEKENLKVQAFELGISDNVEFNDPVENIKNEYLHSSIYVMTSRFESFGMVLLEAKECGLPIVSFDCESGPRDIINNGKDGYLVDYMNEYEFKNKVLSLIKDNELRKSFGKSAKIDAEAYSLEYIVSQWDELLKEGV